MNQLDSAIAEAPPEVREAVKQMSNYWWLWLVFGIIWIIWAGLFHAKPEIRTTLISFSIVSDQEVSIRYSVQRKDASSAATCTLQASDMKKNIVGEIEDEITPGFANFERITEIPTRSAAVTAIVSRCRVK